MSNLHSASLYSAGLSAALAVAVVILGAGPGAPENPRRLSGTGIRAMFSGKQITDEVHWREVYERDGRLRSYAMGKKQIGKWFVHADELCIDLPEPDGGCFEVTVSGPQVTMTPKGLGLPVDGILQTPAEGE